MTDCPAQTGRHKLHGGSVGVGNLRSAVWRMRRKAERVAAQVRGLHRRPDLVRYRDDPVGYCRDVLGVELWGPVGAALRQLLEPPYVVDVDSGHGVGKTHAAAAAVNWWYDTRDPCWVITTAPTDRDVKDLLWTEIRLQRRGAKVRLPDDLQPAAAEMRSGPEHVAKGYTARDANSAHGRHRLNMLFVFDEKEGVAPAFWDGLKSMFRPGDGDAVMLIGNPLTTTSRAYQERRSTDLAGNPSRHLVRLSALDHPNVAAGLEGRPLPVPGAVTAGQVDVWVADWCDPVPKGDRRSTDIRWRGKWYRPGPVGEPRILGLRPSQGTYGVWSEAAWACCFGPEPPIPTGSVPVVGCDVANFGDDMTAFHARCGPVSLLHQAVSGWDHERIADRLRELAGEMAAWATARQEPTAEPVRPSGIPFMVEDDATGRAVQTVLRRNGLWAVPCNASSSPRRPDLYPNLRSESWFLTRNKAVRGLVHLGRLDQAAVRRIEVQALAPTWQPNGAGQRVVEPKDKTKAKVGRSPDDVDAMNLAYLDPPEGTTAGWAGDVAPEKPSVASRAPAVSTREDREDDDGVRLWGRR